MRLFAGACVLAVIGAVLGSCAMPYQGELTTNGGYCHVTGETVDVEEASLDPKLYSDYDGKRYLFCCKGCKKKFDREPVKWITSPAPPEAQ